MIRLFNLAKELNLTSKEIQEKLKLLGFDIPGHISPVPDEAVERLKKSLKEKIKPSKPVVKHRPKVKKEVVKTEKIKPEKEKTPMAQEKVEHELRIEKEIKKVDYEVKHKGPESVKVVDQWSGIKPVGIPKPIISFPTYPVRKPTVVKEEKPKPEIKPKVEIAQKKFEGPPKVISVEFPITIKDFAGKMQVKPNDILKVLLENRIIANINQNIGEEIAKTIGRAFHFEIHRALTTEEQVVKEHEERVDDISNLKPRAPVVTIMGHVDHGKTSLLDFIRKSRVASGEAGGITQHIGAYHIQVGNRQITFLDTPGHEAFTSMRARGAKATDVVVLVVAADDGVMPQTLEAIDHAKAAEVPIVVAMNKIDLPTANIDRLKKQLSDVGLTPEDWGGKTITVPVSAKTGKGMNELLEVLLLEADMLELKASPEKLANGVVIESRLTKNSGPVATFLVQNGTLKESDIIVCGIYWGRVRGMKDDRGKRMLSAGPSYAVEVIGLSGVPQPGNRFYCVQDEKKAKHISQARLELLREQDITGVSRLTLEDISQQIQAGDVKELKIILKADVQGSVEAIVHSLNKIQAKNVKLKIIHTGVGSITESDVTLAIASDSVCIGFNVGKEPGAENIAKRENVDIRLYRIIYELINDIKAAMQGLLEAKTKEVFAGEAIVQQVFKLSKGNVIAGCKVIRGRVQRGLIVRVFREREKVFEGRIEGLKRFKEDVKEVAEGFECGVDIRWANIQEDDKITCYTTEKVEQKME